MTESQEITENKGLCDKPDTIETRKFGIMTKFKFKKMCYERYVDIKTRGI